MNAPCAIEQPLNAYSLIREIRAKFPDCLNTEIASAMNLSDDHFREVAERAGMPKRAQKHFRTKNHVIVNKIRAFMDEHCGGKVDVIFIKFEQTALCVNGRLVD